MSENKDIDTTPVVEVKEEPKAEVKSAPVADAATDYWANAWANRGV
jgi:hypothetical protein